MIDKAKTVINSEKAKTVLDAVGAVLDVAGKTLCCFCRAIAEVVKKVK
jgi:hypothetical protein